MPINCLFFVLFWGLIENRRYGNRSTNRYTNRRKHLKFHFILCFLCSSVSVLPSVAVGMHLSSCYNKKLTYRFSLAIFFHVTLNSKMQITLGHEVIFLFVCFRTWRIFIWYPKDHGHKERELRNRDEIKKGDIKSENFSPWDTTQNSHILILVSLI